MIRQCCFVGDAATGKTTVAAALAAGGEFREIPPNEQIFSTSLKSDGKLHVVQFTDTTGADEYERTRIQSYPAADLFVLLFSIISPSSYESIRSKVRICAPANSARIYQIYFPFRDPNPRLRLAPELILANTSNFFAEIPIISPLLFSSNREFYPF